MKRKGETLSEFLIAAVVFGIVMAGLFEFIANQSEMLADMKIKDELISQAQRFMAVSSDQLAKDEYTNDDKTARVRFVVSKKETLTVTRLVNDKPEGASMTFKLKP